MNLSKVRVILLTILLAAVAIWLTNPEIIFEKSAQNVPVQEKDFSWQTTDSTLWKITPNQPEQQTVIKATQLVYKNEGKSSKFNNPHAFLIEQDSIIELNSQTGHSQDDQFITFEKNVVLTRKQNNSAAFSQLQTEHLLYNVDQHTVSTPEAVNIQMQDATISGKGLFADLTAEEFQLDNNVNSVFYPKQTEPSQQR